MTGRRLALVVAVDQYGHPALSRLAAPRADADALAGALGDPERGGFEVDVLGNPDSSGLRRTINRLLIGREPADFVLLHFSGHGLKNDEGELYLGASDTQPDLLPSTAVAASWINSLMQRCRARRIVLLLDCCYGGAFERGVLARTGADIDVGDQFRQDRLGEGQGRVVITASTAMEYAFEGARLASDDTHATGPSPFSGAVADGIRTGEADRDADGLVSASELYEFVFQRVRRDSPNQTPCKWEFGKQGEMYVARNPNARREPPPAGLDDLIADPLPERRLAAVHLLAPLAAGPDVIRAAEARTSLLGLVNDDSRQVSAAAATALKETEVRLSADTLDLGRVAVGSPVAGEVTVLGGPLALTSTVTTSGPLEARISGIELRVTWIASAAGHLNEAVTLSGRAGLASLRVVGEAHATPAPPVTPELPRRRAGGGVYGGPGPGPGVYRRPPATGVTVATEAPVSLGAEPASASASAANPEAPAERTSRQRRLTTLLRIMVGTTMSFAVAFGIVYLIESARQPDFTAGDCVKRDNNGGVVKTDCTGSDAFEIISVVDSNDRCTDPSQPYVVIAPNDEESQVLCLKPHA